MIRCLVLKAELQLFFYWTMHPLLELRNLVRDKHDLIWKSCNCIVMNKAGYRVLSFVGCFWWTPAVQGILVIRASETMMEALFQMGRQQMERLVLTGREEALGWR